MGGREPGGRVRSGNVREHHCGSTAHRPRGAGGLENLSAQEAVRNLPQKALIYVNY